MRRHFLVLGLIPLILAACASKPMAPAPEAARPVPRAAAPMSGPDQSNPMPSMNTATALPEYLDPNSPLNREHSVYFKFDDSVVGEDAKAVVERHGHYLAQHPEVKADVQGNTDERGGAEYNLALGQRRAEAVKAALKIYGAQDSQIEATSYGSERPMAKGHDEESWRQNRRADIVYSK